MNNVILYGSGMYGQWICRNFSSLLQEQEYNLYGFTDSNPGKAGTVVCGKPVLSLETVKSIENLVLIVAVTDAAARAQIAKKIYEMGLSSFVREFEEITPEKMLLSENMGYYADEKNIQLLMSLMKAHNIKRVVASPGGTNMSLVGSLQRDGFFEIYSVVDERSAAYMACGMAAQCGEPVALSCTGATASRNYMPALTEAFYRKLPVLAITSSQPLGRVGQYIPQVTDRSVLPNDIAVKSVAIPEIHTDEDIWAAEVGINDALLALRRHGGGPAHINLITSYDRVFSQKALPAARHIRRYFEADQLPPVQCEKVGIYVGAHKKWSARLTEAVDRFCEAYNGMVFCDQTSNYKGKYRVLASLACSQSRYAPPCRNTDVMIHIGEVSGSYVYMSPKEVWRVSPDGEVRDTFKKLSSVFEMEEATFFERYVEMAACGEKNTEYFEEWKRECDAIAARIPELPFSNAWAAQQTLPLIPQNSILHLGILNSLRCWNFFETPAGVLCYANTGGFGIDGCLSSLIGASLADPEKLFFGVCGDLAFFYDMNALGNRHIGTNIRILLVNNGCGTEFYHYTSVGATFGDDVGKYIAAAGHYGDRSRTMVKHYAEDMGFLYLSAENKREYLENLDSFVSPEIAEKPVIFEIFTQPKDESGAVYQLHHLVR